MSHRSSDLVPRQQRAPFLTLFIDIAALLLLGGISTKGLWILFLKPKPETHAVPERRPAPAGRTYLKLPDLKTQMLGLAGLIQEGQADPAAPLLIGAILTQLADARARGRSPEEFLAAGFREAGLRVPHTEWVRACVLLNWSVAHEFGLLTPENLELMRRGEAPRVTVGSFRGEAMEIVLQPANDPRSRTVAAFPKLVPARQAKSMQLAARQEAERAPAPQRTGKPERPVLAAPRR